MNRIEKLQAYLKEQPEDCFLKHALAMEWIKLGDDAAARALLEQNLHADPTYLATYYHLGKLLERNREYTEALSLYQKGMEQAVADRHAFSELQRAAEEAEEEYF